jgi:hypothetical protein
VRFLEIVLQKYGHLSLQLCAPRRLLFFPVLQRLFGMTLRGTESNDH